MDTAFNDPVQLSADMAAFLGVPSDARMRRVDVTRAVHEYIRDHGLCDPDNMRVIVPDPAMHALLRLDNSADPASCEPVTFFNIQRHLRHHFRDVPGRVPSGVARIHAMEPGCFEIAVRRERMTVPVGTSVEIHVDDNGELQVVRRDN